MRIINLVQTCPACPSQWDAQTEDGQYVYIRYRWDTLTVSIDEQPYLHKDAVYDDPLRGVMSTEEMLQYTGLEM
jgi:hypothetical protein